MSKHAINLMGDVEIRDTDLDQGNNWCDGCTTRVGEYTVYVKADVNTARTMRLCEDHLLILRDRIEETVSA